MEFGIISFCIGQSPFVFFANAASLIITTILLMKFMKFVSKDSRLHPDVGNSIPKLSVIFLLLVVIIFGAGSILVSRLFFILILNLLLGWGVCTGLLNKHLFEMFIPMVGGFLAAVRNLNNSPLKILRYPLSFIFWSLISFSFLIGVYENILPYDPDYHTFGNFSTFEEYETRIHYWSLAAATIFGVSLSWLTKKSGQFLPKRLSFLKVLFFIFGVVTTLLQGRMVYRETYWFLTHEITGIPLSCMIPGPQALWIPTLAFALTWYASKDRIKSFARFFQRQRNTLPARIRFEQIKNVSACPALWKEMIGDNRERFCHLCGKQTYNLKEITNAEAQNLISKPGDFIYVRKDGAIMATDCYAGLKPIQKLVIRFQRDSKD